MSDNQKTKNNNTLFISLIAILFAIIGGLIFMLNSKTGKIDELNQTVETQTVKVESKTKELEALTADFERIKEEREKLGLNNDSLIAQITQLKEYVAQVKKTGIINSQKRKELESMVSRLRQDLVTKEKEVADLKVKNDSLNQDVAQLSELTKAQSDSLVKTQTSRKNLEGKLAYASVLKAQSVKITILKENGKELDKEEYRSAQISTVKLEFILSDNKAAEKGSKDFYLRMITPSGSSFFDELNGGGKMTLADGTASDYTMKKSEMFANQGEKITFMLQKGFNYQSGTYRFEIYCEGYNIGSGVLKVK